MADEWQSMTADQFCASVRDGTHDSPKPVERGRFLVTSRHIVGGRLDLGNAYLISQDDFDAINKRSKVDQWDVLISMIGTVGEPCLIKEAPNFAIKNIGLFKSKGELEGKWLYYYLRSPDAQQLIREQSRGTTQQYIPLGALREFPVRVHTDKNEMGAIVDVLGTLDDKIELNRRMNETLEAIARAIFKSWFVDFDPVRAKASGEAPESIYRRLGLTPDLLALFPDRLVDSELGEIPEGWAVASLGNLFPDDKECVITGPFGSNLHAHDYRPEGVPLILVKHVIDGRVLDDDLPLVGHHKFPELDRYRLSMGDIVFTRVGAVGRSAYIHARSVGWLISGQMLRVRVPDWNILHPRYLAQLFLERRFIDMVESHALGTTRPSLNTQLLRAFHFVAPPGQLARIFADEINAFDSLVQNGAAQARTLTDTRDTVLPKLLSGELRVSEADSNSVVCA